MAKWQNGAFTKRVTKDIKQGDNYDLVDDDRL